MFNEWEMANRIEQVLTREEFWFGMITFYDKSSFFLKSLVTRFEQIFLRSKKLCKIIEKHITEVQRVQQTMWKKLIQTD